MSKCSGNHHRGKPASVIETDCMTNPEIGNRDTPIACSFRECTSCGGHYTVHVSWCDGRKWER